MDDSTIALTIVSVLLAISLIGLIVMIAINAVRVAFILFEWASTYGFAGLAFYFIAWIFAFPIMLGLCLVLGFVRSFVTLVIDSIFFRYKQSVPQVDAVETIEPSHFGSQDNEDAADDAEALAAKFEAEGRHREALAQRNRATYLRSKV